MATEATASEEKWTVWGDGMSAEEANVLVARHLGKPWATDYEFLVGPSDSTPDTYRVLGRGRSSRPVRRFHGR